MKRTVTIKENHVFRRMYSKGRSAVTPVMVVYCRRNGLDHNRLGVTVSTKLGTAVVRNRARRRLREVYRLAQPGLRHPVGKRDQPVAGNRVNFRQIHPPVRPAFRK